MKRINIIILVVVLSMNIISCNTEFSQLEYIDGDTIIKYSNKMTSIDSPELIEDDEFKSEDLIGFLSETRSLNNLENIRLFFNNDDAYLSVFFTKNASMNDVEVFMGYYSSAILSDKSSFYIIPNDLRDRINFSDFNNKILRVYIDNNLAIRTRHRFGKNFTMEDNIFFENGLFPLNQRTKIELDEIGLSSVFSSEYIEKVKAYEAFEPFKCFVQIEVKENTNLTRNEIVEYIEKQLTDELDSEKIDLLLLKDIKKLELIYRDGVEIVEVSHLTIDKNKQVNWDY